MSFAATLDSQTCFERVLAGGRAYKLAGRAAARSVKIATCGALLAGAVLAVSACQLLSGLLYEHAWQQMFEQLGSPATAEPTCRGCWRMQHGKRLQCGCRSRSGRHMQMQLRTWTSCWPRRTSCRCL